MGHSETNWVNDLPYCNCSFKRKRKQMDDSLHRKKRSFLKKFRSHAPEVSGYIRSTERSRKRTSRRTSFRKHDNRKLLKRRSVKHYVNLPDWVVKNLINLVKNEKVVNRRKREKEPKISSDSKDRKKEKEARKGNEQNKVNNEDQHQIMEGFLNTAYEHLSPSSYIDTVYTS